MKASVNACAKCGADMIAPEWSDHVSDRCVRNIWSCEACGYQFEDTVCFSAWSHACDKARRIKANIATTAEDSARAVISSAELIV